MSTHLPPQPWTGRNDLDEAPDARRWHQLIQPYSAARTPSLVLLGFACDEGVRRNQGRQGAKDGPATIRKFLANLPVLTEVPLADAGDIVCDDQDLEGAQGHFGRELHGILSRGHRAILLGGGHELAYATWSGLAPWITSNGGPRARVGILNLDAHFDLRPGRVANSGTPFRQILDDAAVRGFETHYGVVGVSRAANTHALFRTATERGARWFEDLLCQAPSDALYRWLSAWIDQVDHIHLSIDLDALPAAVAPGVSAPAALGIPLPVLLGVVRATLDSGKVRVVDLAELNPKFDRDDHTARVAARLVFEIASLLTPDAP